VRCGFPRLPRIGTRLPDRARVLEPI
jgi:hypothetical protein